MKRARCRNRAKRGGMDSPAFFLFFKNFKLIAA